MIKEININNLEILQILLCPFYQRKKQYVDIVDGFKSILHCEIIDEIIKYLYEILIFISASYLLHHLDPTIHHYNIYFRSLQ